MKKTKTDRGFRLYEFEDTYRTKCRLQMSSVADYCAVWLGSTEDQKRHSVTGELLDTAMHLNRKMAKDLAVKLIVFAETGDLP